MKTYILILAALVFTACSYSHTKGGKNNSQTSNGGLGNTDGSGEEPTVRFADVKSQVFDTSCTGCHVRKGLDSTFIDYANATAFAEDILDRVFVEGTMPPRSAPKLTQLQLQILKTWLDNGLPE